MVFSSVDMSSVVIYVLTGISATVILSVGNCVVPSVVFFVVSGSSTTVVGFL